MKKLYKGDVSVLGYYTIKHYPLKKEQKYKLTFMHKPVRQKGFVNATSFDYFDDRKKKLEDLRDNTPIFSNELSSLLGYSELPNTLKTPFDKKRLNNLSRAKAKVRDYALCNEFEYFVTLTINKDLHNRYDLVNYKKKLGKFLDNYNRNHEASVKYLLIPEFHKDGAVHMHGLIKGINPKHLVVNEYGHFTWVQYEKSFGFFSCSPVRSVERCSSYIMKYITKDLINIPKGQQVFL